MKKIRLLLAVFLILTILLPIAAAGAAGTNAPLTMRLATRTGPSTAYTEPGTFFSSSWQHTSVRVLSKAYGSGVWWVQVEFTNNGKLYRAYTGAKRVDLDVTFIPEEQELGYATFTGADSYAGRHGPGSQYAEISEAIPYGVTGTIIASENGWLQFDFYDSNLQEQRRAWIENRFFRISWYGNPPADSVAHSTTGNYYCVNDIFTWCQITNIVGAGGYSSINFCINGTCQHYDVPVYMQSAGYGTFTVSEGHGDINFNGEQVILEFYITQERTSERYELRKLPYLP